MSRKQPLVLSPGEFSDIQKLVAPPKVLPREAMRLQRKGLSDSRVQQWPNTLAALRTKKEQNRREREQAEEHKRQIIDKKNAARKARIRSEQVERANKMMYQQTDKMKVLRAGLLLSDVLAEREVQIERKSRRKEILKKREERWVEQVQRKLVVDMEEEREQERAKKEKAKATQATQKQQLELYREKYIAALREEKAEGELIARKAEADFVEEQQKRERIRRRARHNAMELRDANEALKRMKAEAKEREREEEARIEAFARKKEELKGERERRAVAKFAADQAARQAMIDKAVEQLEALRRDEGSRLRRQEAEVRQREEDQVEAKMAAAAKQREAIHKSRAMQTQLRLERKAAVRQQEVDFSSQWRQWNSVLEEEEAEEERKAAARRKTHQKYLKKQIRGKRAARRAEAEAERQEAEEVQERLRAEDVTFQQHAKAQVEAWEAEGKNVVPLKNSLHLLGERLMAAY